MKNKQIDEIISITANQLDIPVEDVKIIVSAYYDHVQDILKTGEYPWVKLNKIGFLYIVRKRLNKRIEKLEQIAEHYYDDTKMSGYKIRSENQKTLQGLYKARNTIKEEDERKLEKRKERKDYEYNYNLERKR